MFLLRPAGLRDLDDLYDLAHHLDSPNLPADRAFLTTRLERSEASFAEPGPPCAEREYQFALVDGLDRVVGTSVILSKHGTRDSPHIYLSVSEEERYSASAEVGVKHVMLRLGVTWDGPTEIGSLVLHPDLRGHAASPGKLVSWGRFAYMARHPGAFESNVLAEMRASIDVDGSNAFWSAFGERFTGMSYLEADRLSATDKSFILDLFPRTPFYASLLDGDVAHELGQVHPDTRPALRLLERAGLHWVGEIDPFDAGPFVGAAVSDVIPIRDTISGHLADGSPAPNAAVHIIHSEESGEFRGVALPAARDQDAIVVPKEARRRLELSTGDEVSLTPFPISTRRRPETKERNDG